MDLPQQFLKSMQSLLGDNYNNYIQAMSKPPIVGIRINPLKVNIAQEQDVKTALGLATNVPYFTNGYYAASSKVGKHPYHIAGCVYVQEPSSMLPVAASGLDALADQDDIMVLDLCAAPGGKSGQIAEILGGYGVLVSNEIEYKRAKALASNIERMGYKNVIITNNTPQELANYLPNTFDYIFVDAPCGGEGMFRKNPDTISQWSEDRLTSNASRQLEILEQANTMLKPGGKLVYSTCTFSVVEDEEVAENFAKKYGYIMILPQKQVLDNTSHLDNECCRRIYPQDGIGEGQFVCVMKKSLICEQAEDVSRKFNPKKDAFAPFRKDVGVAELFIANNFDIKEKYTWCNVGDCLCIIPPNLQKVLQKMQKIAVLVAGVTVGNMDKGRFNPHNNIFLAYGNAAKYKVDFALDNPRLAAYLHGEQLEVSSAVPNGISYGVVCANTHPVGGVRISGKALKNILPKGLRI